MQRSKKQALKTGRRLHIEIPPPWAFFIAHCFTPTTHAACWIAADPANSGSAGRNAKLALIWQWSLAVSDHFLLFSALGKPKASTAIAIQSADLWKSPCPATQSVLS